MINVRPGWRAFWRNFANGGFGPSCENSTIGCRPPPTMRRRWNCCAGCKTPRRFWMEKTDEGLKALLDSGKDKGYLTYDQVNEYLPDDAVNPEKLDQLLVILEEQGIELIDEAEADERADAPAITDDELRSELDLNFLDEGDTRRTDDPVRMYLTQ